MQSFNCLHVMFSLHSHRCVIFLLDIHICSIILKHWSQNSAKISKYTFLNYCTTSVQAINFARPLYHSLYPVEEADPTSLLEIFSMFYFKPNATTSHSSTTVCRHLPQNQATEKPRLTHSCTFSNLSRPKRKLV